MFAGFVSLSSISLLFILVVFLLLLLFFYPFLLLLFFFCRFVIASFAKSVVTVIIIENGIWLHKQLLRYFPSLPSSNSLLLHFNFTSTLTSLHFDNGILIARQTNDFYTNLVIVRRMTQIFPKLNNNAIIQNNNTFSSTGRLIVRLAASHSNLGAIP